MATQANPQQTPLIAQPSSGQQPAPWLSLLPTISQGTTQYMGGYTTGQTPQGTGTYSTLGDFMRLGGAGDYRQSRGYAESMTPYYQTLGGAVGKAWRPNETGNLGQHWGTAVPQITEGASFTPGSSPFADFFSMVRDPNLLSQLREQGAPDYLVNAFAAVQGGWDPISQQLEGYYDATGGVGGNPLQDLMGQATTGGYTVSEGLQGLDDLIKGLNDAVLRAQNESQGRSTVDPLLDQVVSEDIAARAETHPAEAMALARDAQAVQERLRTGEISEAEYKKQMASIQASREKIAADQMARYSGMTADQARMGQEIVDSIRGLADARTPILKQRERETLGSMTAAMGRRNLGNTTSVENQKRAIKRDFRRQLEEVAAQRGRDVVAAQERANNNLLAQMIREAQVAQATEEGLLQVPGLLAQIPMQNILPADAELQLKQGLIEGFRQPIQE